MSMSNVGAPNLYGDGDQKNVPQAEIDAAKREGRFHEGKEGSHKANDPKDERSIANRLAREEKREKEGESQDFESELAKQDATKPAKMHGNEPSKGAKIDQELAEEDAEAMKKKGEFGSKQQ